VWLDVDPDRTGLLPTLWKRGARLDDYVEWALDVPMFLFKRGGQPIVNAGQTFRQFWKSGFEGHGATQEDWRLHLNTLFPEVRLKKTIEVRAADVQSIELGCALPALWSGIFYDEGALTEAGALVDGWTHDEVAELRKSVWREGLRARFRGKPLAEMAERVIAIAEGGLERRARVDAQTGKDERVYLARLRKLAGEGRTPADVLLHGMDKERDPAKAIVERAAIPWE
jgi:glutamate--cysteine ligase